MNKPVILICQGRSGSTTLMRILNTIEGCNICGENWNMIGSLMDFHANLKKTLTQPGYLRSIEDNTYSAWYNVFDKNIVEAKLIEIVRTVFDADNYRVWGFKEIRFGLMGYEVMETRLNNFADLFPEVRMVFLFRKDIEAQLNSGWWADNKEQSRNVLTEQLECFNKYVSSYPARSYIFSMEDMLDMNSSFKSMFGFLEENFDKAKIRRVISNKLDYVTH